jgi:hypothetical protein
LLHPGSRIRIPDPGVKKLRIPDPDPHTALLYIKMFIYNLSIKEKAVNSISENGSTSGTVHLKFSMANGTVRNLS